MSEFLGEAQVLVTPDLSTFVRDLNAGIARIKPPPVVVPVRMEGGAQAAALQQSLATSTSAATKSVQTAIPAWARYGVVLNAASAATTEKGAADAATAASTSQLYKADLLAVEAETRLLGVQEAAVGVTSAVAIARAEHAAATEAVVAANAALTAALQTQHPVQIAAAEAAVANAIGLEAEKKAALDAAVAESTLAKATTARAGSQAQASRGAAATLLSLLGIRGATLAASGAFLGGAAAVTLFVKAVQSAAQLETELATFRATTEATADEMIRVSEAALRLGADITLPSVSAGDAAVAMAALARAGLSVEDSMAGARGVLQLATAAQIDNAKAAELAANALNAFGLAGDQAVRVADDLANAANASQGSIEDMGIALQQAAAVARQVGLSLEDTVSILTLLAKNGLQGSDAGTSLRTALLRLVNPTKEAAGLLEILDLRIRDLNGNIRPDVFAQFAEATSDLSPAMRDFVAATIFGQDAIRAVAIAGREGAQGLRLMQFQIDQQGTAAELADARTSGLAGSVSALTSNLETLGTRLGSLVIGPLAAFVDGINDAVSGVNFLIGILDKVPAELPIKVDKEGAEEEGIGVGTAIKKGIGFAFGTGITVPIIGPAIAVKRIGEDIFDAFSTDATERITAVQEKLNELQKTRITFERADLPDLADALTPEIEELKKRLKELKIEAGLEVPPLSQVEKQVAPLRKALEDAVELRELKLSLDADADVSELDNAISGLQRQIDSFLFNTRRGFKTLDSQKFPNLAKSLQTALAGFKLDPSGQAARGFLQEARKIADQLRKLAPDVSAATRAGVLVPLRDTYRAAIAAAITEGNLGLAGTLQQQWEDLMKSVADGIRSGTDLHVKPAMQQTLSDILAIAEASGLGEAVTLSQLRAREAAQAARFAFLEELGEARGPKQDAEFKRLAAELNATRAAIKRILDEQARRTEDAANQAQDARDKIQEARDKADQAFLDIIGLAETRFANRIARAQLDESVRNDIAITLAYKRRVKELIKNANDRIKDAKVLTETLLRLNGILIGLNADLAKLRQQEREQRQREIARQRESLELDVQIAEVTGNKSALRRALEREIEFYRERIHATRRGSLERKRWILALRQAQKELQELKNEQKEVNNAAKALAFEFLQARNSFAANLLGNLIPGGFTNLVGNVGVPRPRTPAAPVPPPPPLDIPRGAALPTGPQGPLRQAQVEARLAPGGPSRGQAAVEINLLERIYQVLLRIERGAGHPEARKSKVRAGAASEGGGGVSNA